jgi:hypothetical protein
MRIPGSTIAKHAIWRQTLRKKDCGVVMSRSEEPHRKHAEAAEGLPSDLPLLLEEIEKEPVPEKLLTLAIKLQKMLQEKRSREEAAAARKEVSAPDWVKQP